MAINETKIQTDLGRIMLYTIKNRNGDSVTITNLGATITHFKINKNNKELIDIVLGYDPVEKYFENTNTYFGATVGRNANRLKDARFSLNNIDYQIPKNEGENNLHSGPEGYQIRLWQTSSYDSASNSLTFNLNSPDGDQGFPGNLAISVTYELSDETELIITYKGISDKDTIFNLTNHSYFNLNGHDSGSIEEHQLQLFAQNFTPIVDSNSIPNGEICPVINTPFDFLSPKTIGQDINDTEKQLEFAKGYDHNWIITNPTIKKPFAVVKGDKTSLVLEVFTNLPGVQFYTGNYIHNEAGKNNSIYQKRGGFCLETQFYPNAINCENFISPIIKANQEFVSKTIFKVSY